MISRNAIMVLISIALTACATTESAGQQAEQTADTSSGGLVLFVGLESEDAVAVIDPKAGTLIRKIPVGVSTEDIEGVHALTVSPNGEHYYLSIAHGFPYGSVWKMATAKDSLVARTSVGLFPATMAITPDGMWLFVANYNLHGDPQTDTVSVIHTPTMTEVKQVPVCTKPHGMTASHDGTAVYVSCTRDNVLKKISVQSLSVVDSTNTLTAEDRAQDKVCYPAGLALSENDEKLFIACHKHAEVRVMATDPFGTITNAIPVGVGPYLLKLGPDGRLYVPNRDDQSFTVIDVASEEVVATRPASATHPHTFGFGPDGTVYLSMESHAVVPGAIDVIDARTLETVRSIDAGLQATGVGAVALPPSSSR
ncbi:MAG: beta-propeller fold lactonase family protein [Gemmatimonadetes bacterium]|nr:beta-propeller fold lactonase family protein [Gemmatimonadota bacterium]